MKDPSDVSRELKANEPDGEESANIHLRFAGGEECVEVPIPQGQQQVTAALPAARTLTAKITELAILEAEREGRSVSCRAGCGACCRQLVVVSPAEAQSLATLVAEMPAERQAIVRGRFEAALVHLEKVGLLDRQEPLGERHFILPDLPAGAPAAASLSARYWREQIACPFLEDESCSIHPERPLVCREYLVTSPAERCRDLFKEPVELVELPLHVPPAMVTLSNRVAGTPQESIPLVLSLEWAQAHPDALAGTSGGLELIRQLIAAIDEERPLEADAEC